MSDHPSSRSPLGDPDVVWSRRSYRTKGTPRSVVLDGERGVALPIQPTSWLMITLLVLLGVGLAVLVVVGAVRLVQGQAPDPAGTLTAELVCLGLLVLCGLGARRGLHVRAHPAHFVVTPSRMISDLDLSVRWEAVASLSARQMHLRNPRRTVDIAIVVLDERAPLVDLVTGPTPTWVERAEMRERIASGGFTLFAAERLDVDPHLVLRALRALHLDPALRQRLSTDEGPAIFGG